MRVTSQLPIQITKIIYSFPDLHFSPHFEKCSATHAVKLMFSFKFQVYYCFIWLNY